MFLFRLILVALAAVKVYCGNLFPTLLPPLIPPITDSPPGPQICSLSIALKTEIASYQTVANLIMDKVLRKSYKGRTYNDLAYFVDKFGSRLAGTQNLEKSIDFVVANLTQRGHENVHTESAPVPHWIRGSESLDMVLPRPKPMAMLGLGFSIPTPPEGIEAEALVVSSFDELTRRASEAKGKIVVFNEVFVNYDVTVKYRTEGAIEAAKVGAVAALTRSVTPFSINSPHTGVLYYDEKITKIPAACITIEDAELLQRFQNRGIKITLNLKMGAQTLANVTSRNVVAEIVGKTLPNDVVIISGHIDSWDVGQGAMDDGGGVFITVEALNVLRSMNLKPRRTLRAILWTAEEFGFYGSLNYLQAHDRDLKNIKTVMESDQGTFRPLGFDFSGNDEAGCIVQEILKLFKDINATLYRKIEGEIATDSGIFVPKGVPVVNLNTYGYDSDGYRYFYFHHSEGDMMTVEKSEELDLCTAVWAVGSYVIADLSIELPRNRPPAQHQSNVKKP